MALHKSPKTRTYWYQYPERFYKWSYKADPAEKANALNKYFKSVFTVEDNETIPNKGISLHPSLPDFEITTQGVYNILSNCNPYKSPGPDCIHPYALKATATEISPMQLTHIFQQSLDSGVVPTQWKHAYVSPIFKKAVKQILKITALFHLHQWSVNQWNTLS